MTTNKPRGPQELKDLANEQGVRMSDLLALARQNDPFACGTPTQIEMARWFKDLWDSFGYERGVHLRRAHYQLVSQRNPTKQDGTPYENTEGCWGYLCDAGKFARYLGLVPVDAFEDHRNPDPQIFVSPRYYGEAQPGVDVYIPDWRLPTIDVELAASLDKPNVWANGYDYELSDQAYHIEVWVEKSTMNDVLRPICDRMGANLVTSLGFQSITSVMSLCKRIAERGDRPARIFYVSDFDPAGDGMPTAVARQLEFWFEQFAPGADILLTPLVLTREQVMQFRLPRIPIKDSDLRRGNFEVRYGEGAVELDALEALYPGQLAKIVRQAIEPFIDANLNNRLWRQRQEVQAYANDEWQAVAADELDALRDLTANVQAVTETYRQRLRALAHELEADLEPLREEMESLQADLIDRKDGFAPDLPDRETSQALGEDNRDGWLFDSTRDYLEQVEVYKARKGRVE